jgi:FKBP-type peptidyl-prolyl cis-trans isomerase FkpA
MAATEKVKAKAFLDTAAAEPGATRASSGLVYRELAAGSGASPKATDKVRVNYRGTLINGTEFDSSYKRNMPAEFPLNGVIPCWTEGVQKMKVGGKSKLVCPAEIAYGDQGRPSIPPGATLVFEIELLAILP